MYCSKPNLSMSLPNSLKNMYDTKSHHCTPFIIQGAQECTRCKILEQRNINLEKRCRQLKDQQELYQSPFLPTKCLFQKQVERVQKECEELHQSISSVQTGIAHIANKTSALQTNLQVLTDVSTPDQDWLTLVDHSGRDNMISKGNMHGIEECTSEANRQQTRSGHLQMGSATINSQQYQPTEGHHLETIQITSHQHLLAKQRTQSYSVGLGNIRVRVHRADSDAPRPIQVDVSDPQLQSALQKRWEQVEATSSN